MKHFFYLAAIAATTASLMACNKTEVNCLDEVTTNEVNSIPTTKAIGAKSPILAVYVETNDVNPLNAVDYYFDDEDESNLIDIVELFASNIHKETVGGVERPTLYLNDKLTNVLENGGVNTYVKPLQDVNINVLLTVLGDWQHIGVANMTDTQAEQFATILAAVVKHYGLDGIGFDDEYADYYSTNSTSFSKIILTLHGLMSSDKLITVFDWGQTSTISSAAAACIDYAYHGYFGTYRTSSNITGMDKTRWSPVHLILVTTTLPQRLKIMLREPRMLAMVLLCASISELVATVTRCRYSRAFPMELTTARRSFVMVETGQGLPVL